MTDTVRDSKLVQYLSEAYAKERELETALEAHIAMTTKKPYRKRLTEHLRETKSHARRLEQRIKQISGGGPQLADKLAAQAAGKVKSLAKGPLHLVRGTGEAEKMLKNAKTEYFSEHEEIATYSAIEALAEGLGDKDTAKLAREIRREEERMANFLARQIPVLTKAVISEEVPSEERRSSQAGSGSTRKRAGSRSRSGGSKATKATKSGRASAAAKGTRKRARAGAKAG